ncbi:sulfite exporter TauE/SafE family protein [Corynebacterium callunae]|uniref:sulfite exporter TauE/SafE family protein n=1 Tax=Corynebacterium callunae TaxID=1721 RepID=UPI003982926A
MITIAIILLLSVFIGALLQRITGLGVGLVTGPVLTTLLGPLAGVTMVNGLSIINAVNNAWSVRKRTDWARFRILAGALILGSLPAVAVVHYLNGPWLLIVVGALVLLALCVSLFPTEKFTISQEAKLPMIIFGIIGGFMSTIAGIAGPALTVYARLSKWDYRDFVATLHPILLVANTVSFLLKVFLIGGLDFGGTPAWLWIAAVAMIFVGAWFGEKINAKISTPMAKRIATILAAAGAAVVLIRGIMQLV